MVNDGGTIVVVVDVAERLGWMWVVELPREKWVVALHILVRMIWTES